MSVLLAVFLVLIDGPQATPPVQTPAQPCAVATDPSYGRTIEIPVQVGGGAMYVGARERRYLDALRGPDGQPVTYKRLGSLSQNPKEPVFIDEYEVGYEGLDKPVKLYLDAYHFWEPRAPKGFVCGQPIQLQPMLDNFRASADLSATAIEEGASREFTPIPLDAGGVPIHGAIWDGFRVLAAAARAAAVGGKKLDPEATRGRGSVVVAYPLVCGERTIAPVNVELVTLNGQSPPRQGELAKGKELARLLPGVSVPAGSLAAQYSILTLRPSDRVRIAYAETACPNDAAEAMLPLTFTAARPADFTPPALPEGVDPAERRLLLQVVIDLDGAMQRVTYVGGSVQLRQAAMDAVRAWRAEPARVNGAPVPTTTLVGVEFRQVK